MKELGARRRNELHENIVVSKQLAEKERDEMMCRNLNENMKERYLRLASEYENVHLNKRDIDGAAEYYEKALKIDNRDITTWKNYALFSLRHGNLD